MRFVSLLIRLLAAGGNRRIHFVILFIGLSALPSFAQYTKLHDFGSIAKGFHPRSTPISDGTFLYGMTTEGGSNKLGTIYKVKPDGTAFTKLLDFDGANNGSAPYGALFSDGTFLYGMTLGGGTEGHGTIFKIKPDGTGFVKLHDFVYAADGAFPYGALISDGTFMYGMTFQGGANFVGTIFKIKPDGTSFTKLFDFDNTSGYNPFGSLVSDGTFLYGTTGQGGVNNLGTIVKIKPDGTGFAKILDFDGASHGSRAGGSLISDGTFLYGMTQQGGVGGYGTIFKIKPDGTGYVKLQDFNNSTKGAYPKGSLVSDGTFLYGSTNDFGATGRGIIFKIMPDGSAFTKLIDNSVGTFGPDPEGTLLFEGTSLYGVKSGGGAGTAPFYPGTIFKINTDGSGYTALSTFEESGKAPSGSLVSVGTFMYGMTFQGGLLNYGTIFKIKPDGTGFATIFDFDGATTGMNPTNGRLISDGTFLYGMTSQGGVNDVGTLFKIKPDGTSFIKLLDFNNAVNGGSPNGSLISDGTFLYGMTTHGGPSNQGSIFKIRLDGTGFVNLLNMDYVTNGAYPYGSLFSTGGFLYGMTNQGGTNGFGTIFKIMLDGTGFTKLLDFDGTNGSYPYGSLLFDATFFYGMASSGGSTTNGTIFKIKPDGTGFAKLLDFDGDANGGSPHGSLTSDGTFLYGLTAGGGSLGMGTIFKIKPDGTNYVNLLNFNDGSDPQSSLVSDGTFLYGTTRGGGENFGGILFKTSMTPFLSITNFIPTEGAAGTIVTIYGTSFDPVPANNTVMFNGTQAVVKASTATSLTVIVPAGATPGPITVTAGGTDTSINDFEVTDLAVMFDGTVQSCDATFSAPGSDDDVTETFLPVNPSDKVKVSFSFFAVGDVLFVYDGPTTTSPLVATLSGTDLPDDIVATGPGGELTFRFGWEDSSSGWEATISCQSPSPGSPPLIEPTLSTPFIEGPVTIDLTNLISDPDNNLDPSTLQIASQPESGAPATVSAFTLTINYAGFPFTSTDRVGIEACDLTGLCTTQQIAIEFVGDLTIYNAVSPNGDDKNEFLLLEYIDGIPGKKQNKVQIFNRWGDEVFSISNYNNHDRVFVGNTSEGKKLPTGTYYYKISFGSGDKARTGFLELKY